MALLLKNYQTGRVIQRVGALPWAASERVHAWLSSMNDLGYNAYVGVNSIRVGERSRTRHAIAAVRHVFLEFDHDGVSALAAVDARLDLPSPSYVLHSSPGRLHVLWRAEGFEPAYLERLQRLLAQQLSADPAATPVTQTTRIPSFRNHKYDTPNLVTVEYRDVKKVFTPTDFPRPPDLAPSTSPPARRTLALGAPGAVERARLYLRQVPPAISGQHGDLHTFQTCCRLVRGFALDDNEAFAVLADWNAACQPPWTDAELRDKIQSARLYGRETIGGLL